MTFEIDRENLTASYVLGTLDRLVADFNATHPQCEISYFFKLSDGLHFYPTDYERIHQRCIQGDYTSDNAISEFVYDALKNYIDDKYAPTTLMDWEVGVEKTKRRMNDMLYEYGDKEAREALGDEILPPRNMHPPAHMYKYTYKGSKLNASS